jgi:TonB family protein
METLTPPVVASNSTEDEPKLDLLLRLDTPADQQRRRKAGVLSIVFHVVAISALILINPKPNSSQQPPERYFVRHVTPLYIPPELTQKVPNKGPVKKELTLETIAPHPALKAPAPAPAPKQTANKSIPLPPTPTPQAPRTIPTIEPPKIEAALPAQQNPLGVTAQLPPPPGSGQPKITLEDVAPRTQPTGKPTGAIALPGSTVQDALRALNRGGATGGASGGEITFDQGGAGPGLNLPASAGQANGGIRLLSNPEGVDFRPYLIQVMAAIRRNWFAVYPEAAKTGMRGEVVLQFRVAKQGMVAKVVYNGQSPSRPLNEAAVSAISASNPFPPLPVEFHGDHIDLQMRFLYNMPR